MKNIDIAANRVRILANHPAQLRRWNNAPAPRLGSAGDRRRPEVKRLVLQKFESHGFAPKVQVVEDGSLSRLVSGVVSEAESLDHVPLVLERNRSLNFVLIRALPNRLC
jgi:hypothetical protein